MGYPSLALRAGSRKGTPFMRRLLFFLMAFLSVRSVSAQMPAPAGRAPAEQLVTFDPAEVELRWLNNTWQLFAGGTLLRDFGHNQVAGWEAVRLIRALHLTQHGTIGSPRPIMEYWLSDGQAPQGIGGTLLVPLDLASLRVETIQGQWCVCDARRLLFNFGRQQAEAALALDVIRRYGFTQIGYVGWPAPAMMYFLGGGRSASTGPALQPFTLPGQQPNNAARSALLQAQLLIAGTHQLAPPQVGPSNTIVFNPGRVEIKQDGKLWLLRAGDQVLARFGGPMEARQALTVVNSYRFTEQVYLGQPGQSFSYFLVHGQPPRGMHPTIFGSTFRPESVAIRQLGGKWVVFAGDQPLESFGDNAAQAQQLVQVIQRYGFDHLCRIGPPGPLSMTFLVKAR
jgi:hypothetical protein